MTGQPATREPYYQFSQCEVYVRDRAYTLYARPALGRLSEHLKPALLLIESIDLPAGAQVLHMHCGSGLVGAAAAHMAHRGHVTLLDCHSVAVTAARHTLAANQATNAEVALSDCAQAVRERTFDSVLALLPKGRAVWEQTIHDAAQVLRVGGDFLLAGANRAGIKSAAKYVEHIFGKVYVLTYGGGCRVLRAVKTKQTHVPSSDYYTWRTIVAQVDDERLEYATRPGLFSWKQLDGGSRLLIEALHMHPLRADDQVLDIGCGSGVLTLVAARQTQKGHVVGVDVDCRAVEATQRTLALNRTTNAEVLLGDCTEAVHERTFTAVVTNPPFHQERATTAAVAEQIIRDAARHLGRSGRLYLVANSFLPYRPIIEDAFGQAQLLCQARGFKVWYAIKHRSRFAQQDLPN